MPESWKDAAFDTLRAEGAFIVSARMHDDEVIYARISSEAGGVCRMLNPWHPGALVVRSAEREEELQGERVQWDTETGGEYLVFPAGREPGEEDVTPALPRRHEAEYHWFGVKRHTRF